MKPIFYFLVSIIIISFSSCGGSPEKGDQISVINISIDSAMVDAKGQIIDTKNGIHPFGFDGDKNFMYKFNTNNRHGLEIIDMNKLELVDFIPFEVEGPNGTTNRVRDVYFISDDRIALVVYQAILIFNMKGELQQKYTIKDEEFEGDSIPEDFSMEASGLFVPEKNISFNLVNEGHGYIRGFSKIDLHKKNRKVVFIKKLKKLSDYHISLTIDGRMIMLRTYLYTNFQDDKYILSHDMENELYYYDLKADSVIHKKYSSQLSANKNEIFGKDVDSREKFGEIMTPRNRAIRFKNLVYDETRNQYYRFSSFSTTPDQEEENWNIILTIFDENLNQIHEIGNIELDKVPETYFVKDGKIYVYKNMEDEMGFVILSLSEQGK
jgi:hypothetical protein